MNKIMCILGIVIFLIINACNHPSKSNISQKKEFISLFLYLLNEEKVKIIKNPSQKMEEVDLSDIHLVSYHIETKKDTTIYFFEGQYNNRKIELEPKFDTEIVTYKGQIIGLGNHGKYQYFEAEDSLCEIFWYRYNSITERYKFC